MKDRELAMEREEMGGGVGGNIRCARERDSVGVQKRKVWSLK